MKAIIYIRTSTEEQNPLNQLRDCKSLVDGEFIIIQEKQSAFKDKDRLKFDFIKQEIKKGRCNNLICWDWDRLFRNRKKLKEFFEFCRLYNCSIHSFRQKFFEDFYKIPKPFDEIIQELILNLMGWMAEDESKKKSDRVKIAFKNSTKKWGRRPLKNVDKRIKEYHNEGKSVREIASLVHYWDSQRNKKFVSKSYVHKILQKFKEVKS